MKVSSADKTDSTLLARATALIGECPAEAVKLATYAIELAQKNNDSASVGDAALVAAHAYWRAGDLRAVEQVVETAFAAFERGQRRRLGAAYALHSMLFLAHDKVSLSLTAAVKALGYPDLTAKDRARLYTTIAICIHHLVDFPSGRQVLEEYAWPEAERSGDPQTIVACASRCVGMLHAYACWSLNIPNVSTIGAEKTKLASTAEHVAHARTYIAICDSLLSKVPTPDRSWALGQKGALIALAEGWQRAQPLFDEALSYAEQFPREKIMALTAAGCAARVDQKWEVAREYLEKAKALPAAQCAYNQRVLAFELSLVYEALGDSNAALNEMRSFAHLQTLKARLATQWISDPASKRRYGDGFDLTAARGLVLEKIQPAVLKRAVAHVERNLDKRLLLSEVAHHASVSTRTLQNLFKMHHGVPVSEFIRERRMQRASDMLRQGLSVSGVSEQIGYSTLANFSRDYRRRFGCTPSSVLEASAGAGRRYDQFRIEDVTRSIRADGGYRNGNAT